MAGGSDIGSVEEVEIAGSTPTKLSLPSVPAPRSHWTPTWKRQVLRTPRARKIPLRETLKGLAGDALAEFMGVFILIIFGDGVVAQVVLSENKKGDYNTLAWGWGIGVMLGIYASSRAGGHINPAVTLANCIFRQFPWYRFPVYLVAQTLGGLVGAAAVYANYFRQIDAFEGGQGIRTVGKPTSTAGIFCTFPGPESTITNTGEQFLSEFLASAILMFCLFAIGHRRNAVGNLAPLLVMLLILGIGIAWGWKTGYAINLARDFGPRLFTAMVGYGSEVFTYGNHYFWVPVIAPFLGCAVGGLVHDLTVEPDFIPNEPVDDVFPTEVHSSKA